MWFSFNLHPEKEAMNWAGIKQQITVFQSIQGENMLKDVDYATEAIAACPVG